MALPKLLEDLAFISKLGDYPGSDDNLTPEQFRERFDAAALRIQEYLNNQLVPGLDQLIDVEALKQSIIDKTLTQSDKAADAKVTGDKINGLNEQVKKARPYNLLDNSNFRNPVNQRGESSYAGKIIGIDRWQGGAGATLVTLVDEGLKISYNEANGGTGTQPLMQYVNLSEGDAGKTVTFAARIKGGDVRIYFKGASLSYVSASDWTVIVYTGVIPANTEDFYVGLQGKNRSETLCEWMALYDGEYTIDTLPEYQPKGYKVEALNCGALNYNIPVTIASTSWASHESGAYYSIRDGLTIKAEDNPVIDLDLSSVNSLDSMSDINDAWGEMLKITTHDGYIVLYCTSKPEVDIPIKIKVVR